MADNFYIRLGISRNADKASIKRAYRNIAKSCHPDVEGSCGDPGRFRDLQEAYETLADTEKRKEYDAHLAREEEDRIPVRRGVKRSPDGRPHRTQRPSAGPMEGFRRSRVDGDPFAGFFGERQTFSPSGAPEAVHFEAVLSPEEASQGGSCQFPVDIVSPCRWCEDFFPAPWDPRPRCPACGGTGRVRQRCHLPFHIPPGIRHGAVMTLTDPSLPGIRVRVRVLIDG
jgi:molecular chaperone DnaJ